MIYNTCIVNISYNNFKNIININFINITTLPQINPKWLVEYEDYQVKRLVRAIRVENMM